MWILQEYRFFLIIAVIALAGIIALFFQTQNSQQLVDFNTSVKSNFAAIKGQASEEKSLYDVVTIDGENFRGMDNNQLFGLTHKFTSDVTTGLATDVVTDVEQAVLLLDPDFDVTTADAPEGNFLVLFRAGEDLNTDNYATGATLKASTATVTEKGWNLSASGDTIFVFDTPETAEEIIAEYVPEGTLVGNSVVLPFLNN